MAAEVGRPAARAPLWVRGAWLLPLLTFAAVLAAPSEPLRFTYPWFPQLGVHFAFHVDGLSRLFLFLISGIGTLVFLYAPAYLDGHPGLPRLIALLTAFMLAMIGAVTADDLLLLFVFWEATSVLSFLLIGFDYESSSCRDSARQALLVTAGGGLVLLAGVVLVQLSAPGLTLSGLPQIDDLLREDPRFATGVALILVGCMTKSAQFPFHFWLPGAMSAPTPVSAYLHSATMVKLGIYLMARFDEAMGSVLWWETALITIGTTTAVWTSVLVLRERDLKRIFAWSTVCALGTMTLLIGLPNEWSALALTAFVLAHALYKAPLFFVAGNVDHATGTRVIDRLRGLGSRMPITAAAAVLAGLSMAGLPATFGFVAKDVITTAKKLSDPFWIVGSAILFVSALGVALAAVATLRIFFGRPTGDAANAHDEGLRLALPPLFLAATGIVFGLMPDLAANVVVDAARVIAPSLQYADANLDTEWGPRFGSTATVLALGACVYATWDRLHAALEHLHPLQRFSPSRAYDWGLASLKKSSTFATTRLNDGRLGTYLLFAALGTVLLVSPWVLIPALTGAWTPDISTPIVKGDAADIPVLFGCAIVLAGAALALFGRDTLQQLLGSGAIGVGSAFIFLFRGAPDLALTQLAVETVFVIVAAVAIRRYRPLGTSERLQPLGALTSGAFGVLVGSLLFTVMLRPYHGELADYFLSTSVPGAHGRNVVNVIIVDFRGLDTLGEITVVLLAALAARALVVRHRARRAGA